MAAKKSKQKDNPASQKRPKIGSGLVNKKKTLVWKMANVDCDGPWSWDKLQCSEFLKDVWEKMRHFETMTWDSMNRKQHHMVSVSRMIPRAQERLRQLGRDQLESLASFHFNGKKRIWAHRIGNEFWLLWWDPKHEVCPSSKRGT